MNIHGAIRKKNQGTSEVYDWVMCVCVCVIVRRNYDEKSLLED